MSAFAITVTRQAEAALLPVENVGQIADRKGASWIFRR